MATTRFHFHVQGQVQGVGFRPFVYRLAREIGLPGWVNNTVDGVHIEVCGEPNQLYTFGQRLVVEMPVLARITAVHQEELPFQTFPGFQIIASDSQATPQLLLSPDFGLCPDCKQELHQSGNFRAGYAFITCTNCGPRYSIITGLPYDRPLTTMQGFPMCLLCQAEYDDPLNRRYYSQTNSCPNCGIQLEYVDGAQNLGNSEALDACVQAIAAGKIVAVKGIGGFLLMADATNAQAIQTLRQRKQRPSKPFALLYPDLELLAKDVVLSAPAIEVLQSPVAPIVLAPLKAHSEYTSFYHRRYRFWLRQNENSPRRSRRPRRLGYRHHPTQSVWFQRREAPKRRGRRGELNKQRSCPPMFQNRVAAIPASGVQLNGVAPGLKRLGVMLPYTPLLELLSSRLQRPLIATSGNLSHQPIAYTNAQALERLRGVADALLLNNRDIVIPQDDSVITFTPRQQQKIILRRSRGLAPTLLLPHFRPPNGLLAMGALLKSTFAFTHQNNLYLSQYLGDLEDFDTQQNYEQTLQHLLTTLQVKPECILVDMHPEYASSVLGRALAKELGIPVFPIQHHLAHFGVVLAEHNLLDQEEVVLGVIWDGVGLGEDGQIWGGEFFIYQQGQFQRRQHLGYYPYFMGDKMAREPRLSAMAILGPDPILVDKFSASEWANYQVLWAKKQGLQTSSMGRVFDAVAALLGIMDVQTYEGEAALRLEELAWTYWQTAPTLPKPYGIEVQLSAQALLLQIKADVQTGLASSEIAFKFHLSLIQWIKKTATEQGIHHIAFSGGVWQNSLLVDLAREELEAWHLYFQEELSPNDEGIALGQLVVYERGYVNN